MLTRQQAERLALHAAQKSEAEGLLFRVRSVVAELIGRTPGLRSVLGHIQKMTHLDPHERHRLEDDALARRQSREKLEIERRKRFQFRIEKREALSREKALRREQRLAHEAQLERIRTAEQARTADNKAKQDFYDAAKDDGLWKHKEFEDGELDLPFKTGEPSPMKGRGGGHERSEQEAAASEACWSCERRGEQTKAVHG